MKLQNFENLVGVELEKTVSNRIMVICPHDNLTEIFFRISDAIYLSGGCGLCKDILEREPIQIADTNEFWFDRLERLVEESGEITNDGPDLPGHLGKFKMDYREASGRDPEASEIGDYKFRSKKATAKASRDFTCRIVIYDRPEEEEFIRSITDHKINTTKNSNKIAFPDTALVWALVGRGMKFFDK